VTKIVEYLEAGSALPTENTARLFDLSSPSPRSLSRFRESSVKEDFRNAVKDDSPKRVVCNTGL